MALGIEKSGEVYRKAPTAGLRALGSNKSYQSGRALLGPKRKATGDLEKRGD